MSDTSTNWFGISMVLIGVIVGYGVAMSGGSVPAPAAPTAKVAPTAKAPTPAPAPAAPEAKDVVPVDPKEDYIKGDPNALISIIEYSDFECPFCVRHHPTLQAMVDNNNDVNWVYRHFPLSFHQNAAKLAEGAECAGELGGNDAFWTVTDLIMGEAKLDKLPDYAAEAGVDAAKFQDCLDSGKYAQKVKDQMAGGSAGGVTGTPGNIVINNKTGDTRLVSGAQPESAFQAAVDALR